MIAAWVVALALAGAPAHSPYSCDPQLVTSFGADGVAYMDEAFLGSTACAALLVSSMTPTERAATQRLNNTTLGWLQGEGLLIALHEARHLSGDNNECRVETFAYANLHTLIDRYVPRRERWLARQAAYMYDLRLGPEYRDCS